MPGFAASYDPREGPLIPIEVSVPGAIVDARGPGWRRCVALVDTGASMTALSHDLIAALRLPLIGQEPVAFADVREAVETFLADIRVPLEGRGSDEIGLECPGAQVFRVSAAPSHQAILGRDLLASVVFTFDGPGRRFTLELPER